MLHTQFYDSQHDNLPVNMDPYVQVCLSNNVILRWGKQCFLTQNFIKVAT